MVEKELDDNMLPDDQYNKLLTSVQSLDSNTFDVIETNTEQQRNKQYEIEIKYF